MSKRRELQQHSDSLADIGELLGAMKNLALVESRRIATFIDAQRAAARIVETTLADFIRDYSEHIAPSRSSGEVLCIVGSERGFCGDLNQRLIAAAEEVIATGEGDDHFSPGHVRHSCDGPNPDPAPDAAQGASPPLRGGNSSAPHVVLVGSRLADAWSGDAAARIPGAGFADEVQNVLVELVATLTPLLQTADQYSPPALRLLYLGEGGAVVHPLLPVPMRTPRGKQRSHPLHINLPPRRLHAGLIDQFLETALGCALYDALLYENQQRLDHMEQARQRIDEQLEDLARRTNRARQEEITEEIEIILLSSFAAEGD